MLENKFTLCHSVLNEVLDLKYCTVHVRCTTFPAMCCKIITLRISNADLKRTISPSLR